MKTFIQFLHKSFSKADSTDVDSVRSFFVEGKTGSKKLLYEKALRAAEVDQKKVIAEYYKKTERPKQI